MNLNNGNCNYRIDDIEEVKNKIYTSQEIKEKILETNQLILKAKKPVCIGEDFLLKVNLNIGISKEIDYNNEIEKINKIINLDYRPDSIMDCSIIKTSTPIWKYLIENFDGAVGALPHYMVFDKKHGININELLNLIIDMGKNGISFITLHPTANLDLFHIAKNDRTIPITSRGGYVLLKDQLINKRANNIIAENFEELMKIFKKYNIVLSVGSAFRPATIHESLDECQLREIELQKYYINIAKKLGVKVMMEGVGHISLDRIEKYADLIRDHNAPLMPLGPMVSDEIIGFDHVNNALGALSLANTGVVGMINCVTREEHTGKIPDINSLIEGLKTSRVVAHCYNITKFSQYKEKTEIIGLKRAKNRTCVQTGGIFNYLNIDEMEINNCSRCSYECPLKGLKGE